jgi:hypothetical protein
MARIDQMALPYRPLAINVNSNGMTTTFNTTNTFTTITTAANKDLERMTAIKFTPRHRLLRTPQPIKMMGVKLDPIIAAEREDVNSKS